MKVILPGKAQIWSMEVTCTGSGNGGFGCEALLEIELDDIFLTESGGMDDYTDIFHTFKCIQCNRLTDLPKNTLFPRDAYEFPSQTKWERSHKIEK